MSEDNDIKINVADDVASNDGIGGGNNYMEQAIKFLSRYVPPHNKVSREVTDEDLDRVISEGEIMFNLCAIPRGGTRGAEAIAHMQIEDKDPLAFFVTKNGEFVINPKIQRTTGVTVDSEEGCMSFPAEPAITVQRHHKIEATFQTLLPGEGEGGKPTLSPALRIGISGHNAKIFQHECSHINGWNIYDTDLDPNACRTSRTELDKTLKDK